MNKLVKVFFIAAILFPAYAHAQEKEPYSDITIGIRYSNNVNRNRLHNGWSPQDGLNGYVTTPFYFGKLQGGLRIIEFEAKTEDIPDFNSWYIYAGWGKEMNVFEKLEIYGSVNAGSFQMNFNDPSLADELTNESEFAIEISTSFSYPVIRNLFATVSGTYQHVFTHNELNLYFLEAGLQYRFKSPQWLKDFLR